MHWHHLSSAACLLLISVSSSATETTAPPSPFDGAALLANPDGASGSLLAQQIFETLFSANMRVPPRHLGVAFHDKRTGDQLDRQEIRDLMGAIRQDGAHQGLHWAAPLLATTGLDGEQLELLLDAAFIASMRRPPQHIDIEFYDRRQGPSGRGGGISGSTPNEPFAPEADTAPTTPPPESQQRAEVPPLPETPGELIARIRGFGFSAEERDGQLVFPLIAWGDSDDDLPSIMKGYLNELAAEDLAFHGLATRPHIEVADDWIIVWGLAYVSTGDPALRAEIKTLMEGVYKQE